MMRIHADQQHCTVTICPKVPKPLDRRSPIIIVVAGRRTHLSGSATMSGSSPMWRAPPPPPSILSTAARSPSAAARMKRWLSPCESGWCGGRAGLLRIPACTVCTSPLPKSTTMLVSKQKKEQWTQKYQSVFDGQIRNYYYLQVGFGRATRPCPIFHLSQLRCSYESENQWKLPWL